MKHCAWKVFNRIQFVFICYVLLVSSGVPTANAASCSGGSCGGDSLTFAIAADIFLRNGLRFAEVERVVIDTDKIIHGSHELVHGADFTRDSFDSRHIEPIEGESGAIAFGEGLHQLPRGVLVEERAVKLEGDKLITSPFSSSGHRSTRMTVDKDSKVRAATDAG